MKLHGCLLAALAVCAPLVRAQYFSDGWKPGQPTTQASNAAPTGGFDPAASQAAAAAQGGPASSQGNFLERVLKSGPLSNLFAKTGVNITERLEAAHAAQAAMWDQRIPLITDENYNDLIVNETFASEEEERARVWFLVITAQASSEPMSKYVDQVFEAAYNVSVAEGDLSHVRFGRIDYLSVTYITTKWAVWSAPYLVVVKDRGQSIRFYRPAHIKLNPQSLHRFLKVEGYNETPLWTSAYGPGGSREWLMDRFARVALVVYTNATRLPRFALMALTGFAGSFLIQLFHRGDKKKFEEEQRKKRIMLAEIKKREIIEAAKAKTAAAAAAPASPAKASPSKKKKGGKK